MIIPWAEFGIFLAVSNVISINPDTAKTLDFIHKILSVILILPTIYSLLDIVGKKISNKKISQRIETYLYLFEYFCTYLWFLFLTINVVIAIITKDPTMFDIIHYIFEIFERIGEMAIYILIIESLDKLCDLSTDDSYHKLVVLTFLINYMFSWFFQVMLFPIIDNIKYYNLICGFIDLPLSLFMVGIVRSFYTIFIYKTLFKLINKWRKMYLVNCETFYEEVILVGNTSRIGNEEKLKVQYPEYALPIVAFVVALEWERQILLQDENYTIDYIIYLQTLIILCCCLCYITYIITNYGNHVYNFKNCMIVNKQLIVYFISYILTMIMITYDNVVKGEYNVMAFNAICAITVVFEAIIVSNYKIKTYIRIPILVYNIGLLFYDVLYIYQHLQGIAGDPELKIQYIVQCFLWVIIEYHLYIITLVAV